MRMDRRSVRVELRMNMVLLSINAKIPGSARGIKTRENMDSFSSHERDSHEQHYSSTLMRGGQTEPPSDAYRSRRHKRRHTSDRKKAIKSSAF